jgi:hypothetical protein
MLARVSEKGHTCSPTTAFWSGSSDCFHTMNIPRVLKRGHRSSWKLCCCVHSCFSRHPSATTKPHASYLQLPLVDTPLLGCPRHQIFTHCTPKLIHHKPFHPLLFSSIPTFQRGFSSSSKRSTTVLPIVASPEACSSLLLGLRYPVLTLGPENHLESHQYAQDGKVPLAAKAQERWLT